MSRPKLRLPIGQSDFRMLRRQGLTYVDKSGFIVDVLEASAAVLLLPRPRRFGKTLNLSMLRYYLDLGLDLEPGHSEHEQGDLFAGLAVQRSELARPHRQRYPVIFLTFKDIKESSWESYQARMTRVLADLYQEHEYLLDSQILRARQRQAFEVILDGQAPPERSVDALRELSRWLALHHGEPVVILIDEYDTPLHAAYHGKYYEQAVGHLRGLLSGGFKDNPHLFKGVLTGILRVAKESIFSGLNNLAVYSILRTEFATAFGFTEAEVTALAEQGGSPEAMDGIRQWYDGYRFGGQTLYNPWSVLCYLDSADRELRPYWIATSSNDLVREMLLEGPQGLRAELETLLVGGVIDKPVEEHIVLRDLHAQPDAVWSFLLFSGYLRMQELYTDALDRRRARLDVPNREVRAALNAMVQQWMSARVGGSSEVQALLRALLEGDARSLTHYLSRMVKVSLSYHDTGGPQPERVIHGFIVGLLVSLQPDYEVRSNRESGYGRYDVMVLPRTAGKPGAVLELKTVDEGEDPAAALDAGLRQLRDRDYATELRERGADPVIEWVAAFDGKRAFVARAGQ
ncbi:MAG: AAA family ATPase [Myxococcota bacterium]